MLTITLIKNLINLEAMEVQVLCKQHLLIYKAQSWLQNFQKQHILRKWQRKRRTIWLKLRKECKGKPLNLS